MKKGFTPIFLIVGLTIVAAIVLIVGRVYYFGKKSSVPTPNLSNQIQSSPNSSPMEVISTTTINKNELNSQYFKGSYPNTWFYKNINGNEPFINYNVCTKYDEIDQFTRWGVNNLTITVCDVAISNPEDILEKIAQNTQGQTYKYSANSATSSTRFGLQGLRGQISKGIYDGSKYEPQYIEIYVKNNRMFLLEAGDNSYIDELLANINFISD